MLSTSCKDVIVINSVYFDNQNIFFNLVSMLRFELYIKFNESNFI